MDDFGTGYSSLSYLQQLPVRQDQDRPFLHQGRRRERRLALIVQAIVSIAVARHMATTAEGVETEQQFDALRGLGCTEMQGYLFSKPLSAADINDPCDA